MAFSSVAFSKGVGAGLGKLNDSIRNDVGFYAVVIAVTVSGFYIALGKKEGMEKFSAAIVGAIVIALGSSIAKLVWDSVK